MDNFASQAKQHELNAWGPTHLLPRYLQPGLSRHALCIVARFCLRTHILRDETGCWQIHNRNLDKCGLHNVQDKRRVLYLRPCMKMCYLRKRFAEQIADFTV